MTKSLMEQKRTSPQCEKYRLSPLQKSISVFALLGVSFVIAGLFAVVYFLFERLGITPYLSVFNLSGFTEGETWLIFIYMYIIAIFLPLLLIWSLYRYYRLRHCSDLDTDIETLQ